MSLNPRVTPDDLTTALGWSPGLGSVDILAYGVVQFDMGVAGDLAIVTAGGYKDVIWYSRLYASPPIVTTELVHPGALSAFALVPLAAGVVDGSYLYDDAAEITLMADMIGGGPLACAWWWPEGLARDVGRIVDLPDGGTPIIAYAGAPVSPIVKVRSGMVPGTTPADAVATFVFALLAMPQVAASGMSIVVPSPWCAPPFDPIGAEIGTHLFSAHALVPMPSRQILPFQRLFRTRPLPTTGAVGTLLDAHVLGGPWRGHLMGATDGGAATGAWTIEGLLSGVPTALPYTPAVIEAAGGAASASLSTLFNRYESLRFTHTDPDDDAYTEIVVDYPGE